MQDPLPVKTIIEPRRSRFAINLRELIQYRELLFMLAYRDYRIRYAQTTLGFAWALIQPVLTLAIFILVFDKAIQVETGGIPYPVFAMTGMWAWSYFSYVITQAGQSIIQSQSLVTKIYFPRLIIPLSKSIIGFIDFAIAFVILLLLMLFLGVLPDAKVIALPIMIILLVMFSLSIGIWLSALTIRFRDIQHVIPFIVQIGLYLSPVGYPSSQIPSGYKSIYYLNPMAGIIDGFRWSLLNTSLPETRYLIYTVAVIFLILISGIYYFEKVESTIADII